MIVFPVTGSDSDSSSGSESDDHEEREHTPEDKDSMGKHIPQVILKKLTRALFRFKVFLHGEKPSRRHE